MFFKRTGQEKSSFCGHCGKNKMNVDSDMVKNKTDIERGERIRALNKEAGYTGSDLSSFLHYKGHSSVSKLFSGDIKPTNDVLKKLSQFFGVSVDYILNGTPKESHLSANTDCPIIESPEKIKDFDKNFERLDKIVETMQKQMDTLVKINDNQNTTISRLTATIENLSEENANLKSIIKNNNNGNSNGGNKKASGE